jgi:NDP-sugar pyrophosphorylase family protein
VTTHYLADQIESHLGNGKRLGVDITYVAENQPLGTAGALSLLKEAKEPLLVVNADIVTDVDFAAMLEYHQEHDADMTVAVREYTLQVPFGVVEGNDIKIERISEKPQLQFFVTAGIYLLEPHVVEEVPRDGSRFDMPDLINRITARGCTVVSFPIREYWVDIGQLEDYERANARADQTGGAR